MLVINNDRGATSRLALPVATDRYTLTSENLQSRSVRLNGRPLQLDANDDLPTIAGEATGAGDLDFAPASISFLALPSAGNPACG